MKKFSENDYRLNYGHYSQSPEEIEGYIYEQGSWVKVTFVPRKRLSDDYLDSTYESKLSSTFLYLGFHEGVNEPEDLPIPE